MNDHKSLFNSTVATKVATQTRLIQKKRGSPPTKILHAVLVRSFS
jgi:hypothetical protein